MDVELGIDYAKRNAKRIFEWLKQTHAVLGIIGYHRFDEIGKSERSCMDLTDWDQVPFCYEFLRCQNQNVVEIVLFGQIQKDC